MREKVMQIAQQAGQAIMQVYSSADPLQIQTKSDNSPLTLADQRSHDLIFNALSQLTPQIPILSEEKPVDYSIRSEWDHYWCVDPLDGTKDFIAKNGAFTVNIALIENRQPILGVIHIPAQNLSFSAEKGTGCFKDNQRVHNNRKNKTELVSAMSNFHSSEQTISFLKKNNVEKTQRIGSAIKFCAFAEGLIDVYPRFGPTSEWDTAAGQVIVEEAGGKIGQIPSLEPLDYNKPNLLNPFFLLTRPDLEWTFE